MINVAVPVVVGTVFVVVGQKEKNKQRFFNLERRFAFVYLFLSRRLRGRRYSNGSRVDAIRQAGQVTRISPRHRRLVYGVSVCVCVCGISVHKNQYLRWWLRPWHAQVAYLLSRRLITTRIHISYNVSESLQPFRSYLLFFFSIHTCHYVI